MFKKGGCWHPPLSINQNHTARRRACMKKYKSLHLIIQVKNVLAREDRKFNFELMC